jgi:putative PIN family toxin of toxin-antitoxin system
MSIQTVIDTNVIISALRSKRGASHKLLSLIDSPKFEINISVPLILEYEDVAKRQSRQLGLTHSDIDDILDYICLCANHWRIFFLWRPYLKDPRDDMVLELAVESQSKYIITYNRRDFEGLEKFGIATKSPKELLQEIGEIK